LQAAHSQEQELSSLQEALGQCRTELKAANIKNSELKKSLDEITLQLKKRVYDLLHSVQSIHIISLCAEHGIVLFPGRMGRNM